MSHDVLFLCTGNATRSVIGEALMRRLRPDLRSWSVGTFVIEGQPVSLRTREAFAAIELELPPHRTRQATRAELESATLVVAFAHEHVQWIRREHPDLAGRTGTLKRLDRDLQPGGAPLAERVAALGLAEVALEAWEEVVDPGGQDTPAFVACALELAPLVTRLAARL